MAYKSKYTGLQIDDILDSVGGKQNEIEDLASIRAGAQKGTTALQSYTEKYTGTVTGIKINGETKTGSGVIDLGTTVVSEADPIFSASPAFSITEEMKISWNEKQEEIFDLDVIREGAALGSTALQEVPSEYITETELESKNYLTEHQDISHLASKEELNDTVQSRIFIGTDEEYNLAYSEGKITEGALVIILDGSETEDGGTTISALLGTAILGQMLLGNK